MSANTANISGKVEDLWKNSLRNNRYNKTYRWWRAGLQVPILQVAKLYLYGNNYVDTMAMACVEAIVANSPHTMRDYRRKKLIRMYVPWELVSQEMETAARESHFDLTNTFFVNHVPNWNKSLHPECQSILQCDISVFAIDFNAGLVSLDVEQLEKWVSSIIGQNIEAVVDDEVDPNTPHFPEVPKGVNCFIYGSALLPIPLPVT